MRTRCVDTRHLAAFLAAARHGSISGAAKDRYVVQTTLGRQIEALEADVGAALFERGPRGVSLTPAGARFLPYAETVLECVARAERAVKGA